MIKVVLDFTKSIVKPAMTYLWQDIRLDKGTVVFFVWKVCIGRFGRIGRVWRERRLLKLRILEKACVQAWMVI